MSQESEAGCNDYGDIGLGGSVSETFQAASGESLEIHISVSEGGFLDEAYNATWSGGTSTVSRQGRSTTIHALLCDGESGTITVTDGGTVNPPTNPVEYGADITICSESIANPGIVLLSVDIGNDRPSICGECEQRYRM